MNVTSAKKLTKIKKLKKFFKNVVKGKVFLKDEFGTGLADMTLRGIIRKSQLRLDGVNQSPAKLVLTPEDTSCENASEVIRIFVGSEPAQHRAERVLLWSILKHRCPSKQYEIHIMKDLAGFNRRYWKTGFTAYRYAVPELAGFKGRAIYNDVDQIYLDDPALLTGENMNGAAVLALHSRDTSVMLMACDMLLDIWTIAAIKEAPDARIHSTMLGLLGAENMISDLPAYWNSRDHEYTPETSKLLHYTILHTQPWMPFPSELRYRKSLIDAPWFELEATADQQGFAPLWKFQAGRPYSDMENYFKVVNGV